MFDSFNSGPGGTGSMEQTQNWRQFSGVPGVSLLTSYDASYSSNPLDFL